MHNPSSTMHSAITLLYWLTYFFDWILSHILLYSAFLVKSLSFTQLKESENIFVFFALEFLYLVLIFICLATCFGWFVFLLQRFMAGSSSQDLDLELGLASDLDPGSGLDGRSVSPMFECSDCPVTVHSGQELPHFTEDLQLTRKLLMIPVLVPRPESPIPVSF